MWMNTRMKMTVINPVILFITMSVVMATNTVKMEKMTSKMAENKARIGVVELDKSWPLSDEFKAILGIVSAHRHIKYFIEIC